MTSELENRIHDALKPHPLERIECGYRFVNETGSTTLRFSPADEMREGMHLVAVAEIATEFNPAAVSVFDETGLQRLNARAVNGAYVSIDGRLHQMAKYSIYENEPASHLAVKIILDTFGDQLPYGLSVARAAMSPVALERERAHHAAPRRWAVPLPDNTFKQAAAVMNERGLFSSEESAGFVAEIPMSGDVASRLINTNAETALLRVDVATPHPIAGAGYYATIGFPVSPPPEHAAEICRRLNDIELEQNDFVPRIGAWGLRGVSGEPVYSCFIPAIDSFPHLHTILMWWCARRAAWFRDRFWTGGAGFTRNAFVEEEV